MYGSMGGQQLFRTEQTQFRVGLARIARKCVVSELPAGPAGTRAGPRAAEGLQAFTCSFLYSPATNALRPLPLPAARA